MPWPDSASVVAVSGRWSCCCCQQRLLQLRIALLNGAAANLACESHAGSKVVFSAAFNK
jgi:hypothetical protein